MPSSSEPRAFSKAKYREGGFHSDWKQVCLRRDLLDRIANDTDFFAALDVGNRFTRMTRSCAQNAFVGAAPRHRIVARYLKLAMENVGAAAYPRDALLATGPCAFGRAVRDEVPDFGNDTLSWPLHRDGAYTWRGEEGEAIVLSKCDGCGHGQDWELGNNYYRLFEGRRYYCEDAASVFGGGAGGSGG